jgi:hypothetical protein
LLREICKESCLQVAILKSNIAETKGEVDVLVKLDKISDGKENCVQGIGNNVFAEHSSCSNWNRVGIDASESLLEDRVLAL